MTKLSAFIGHSFNEDDEGVVRIFLSHFDRIKDLVAGFTWDHAEKAEPKILSEKVKEKMKGKNLFVGICTAKERVISPEKLEQRGIFNKFLKSKEEDYEVKTSDWIIQEIGYAIAKDMDIILLIEQGLRMPGGLQGDLEYVYFSRENPEKSFNQILEMLTSLIPKPISLELSPIDKIAEDETEKDEIIKDDIEIIEPTAGWGFHEYRYALLRTIARKDKANETEIVRKYLETEEAQGIYEKLRWQATQLYLHQMISNEENLEELLVLQKQHPDHNAINYYVGNIYGSYRDYNKAANYYKIAAENTKNDEGKLRYYCKAAISIVRGKDENGIDSILNKAKGLINTVEGGKIILLETMRDIANIKHNYENYTAFIEGILNEKPDDNDNRFSLAYKYADLKENDLALYHYKLLLDKRPNESAWNNYGVSAYELDLKGKAINAYREAEKLGNTLAMGNIASKFIDTGFLNEAKEVCNRALTMEDISPMVTSALSKIEGIIEEEERKELAIFDNTNRRRSFFIEYADACCKTSVPDFSGEWQAPNYRVNITKNGNKVEGIGEFEQTSLNALASAWVGLPAITEKITMEVKYSGDLIGHGIKYKLWIHKKGHVPTLLGDNPDEGLMIISDNLSEIKVYKKGTKTSEEFYSLNKIS